MGLAFDPKDGQTPLSEEEREGLKIKSLNTHGELNTFEQLNIEKAVEWTIHANFQPAQILTEKFLRDLHKRMYGDVWNWAGQFRKTEKNIGIKWTQIGIEVKNLLDDTMYWIENNTYPPDEIVIRYKHRLVSIHCFPNGNGRHSRLMADIMIESIFNEEVFSWHQSNMVKANAVRKTYIDALKAADNGNIEPLLKFARS